MTRDEKIARAMTDALTLLRIGGHWTAAGEVWVLMLAGAHFVVAYRSRIRKLPNVHPRLNAELLTADKRLLCFGLDVWVGGSKAMNIEWGDSGEFVLSAFEPGRWQG
jgi:hypothetical protein